MTCIEGLIRDRIAQGEARLKDALRGFFTGSIVRGYLSQVWTITMEADALTIQADVQGNIRVLDGAAPDRDGDIRIRHDDLSNSIRTGKAPPPGSYQVTFYTPKGQTAFGYLRSSFCL